MSRHYINKQHVFRTLASIAPIFLTSSPSNTFPQTLFKPRITHSLESKHAINSKKMPPKKSKKPTSLKVPETESARKKLTVAQLRNVLVSLGLSVDGLKADLLLRLETHLLEEKKEDEEKGGEVGARKRARSEEKKEKEEEEDKTAVPEKEEELNSELGDTLGKFSPKPQPTEEQEGAAKKTKKAKVEEENGDTIAKREKSAKSSMPRVDLTQIGAYERLRARRVEIRYENFPADADEALVRRVFETYGDVREIFSSGSNGVVRFQTQEAAESALAALENGSYVMDGCEKGVRVRWATWEEDLKSNATEVELDLRKFVEEECDETTRSSKQIWIGASSKLASDELVKAWLERFGEVESFKAFRKEKHFSFLATYAKEEDAKLCFDSLNEKQPPGSLVYHAPLRVDFTIVDETTRMSLEKMAQKVINPQQQQQQQQQSPGGKALLTPVVKTTESPAKKQEGDHMKRSDSRDAMPPGMVVEPPSSSEPTTPDVIARYLRSVYSNGKKLPRRGQFDPPNVHHYGPPSEKLYVSSIPACFDKNAVAPMFEALGEVTDVHILFDRHTKKHKGSGFVTFRTVEEAERTIALLDQKYILDNSCLLYTSPSPRDATLSRMPSSA